MDKINKLFQSDGQSKEPIRQLEDMGDWWVWYDPLPTECRDHDWRFCRKIIHTELDVGTAESRDMCLQTIDFIESEETPEAISKSDTKSKEWMDKWQNVPLILQLGQGLRAVESSRATSGKGALELTMYNIFQNALAAFNQWQKEREGVEG